MLEYPNFEYDYWSRTAIGFYKIGHDSIRLMKWLAFYDRTFYGNINYYNLMGSPVKFKQNWSQVSWRQFLFIQIYEYLYISISTFNWVFIFKTFKWLFLKVNIT